MSLSLDAPLWLIGAGKMGSAMAAGWLEEGLDPALVTVQDPQAGEDATALFRKYGVEIVTDIQADAPRPSVVILAVKPQIMDGVLEALGPRITAQSVVLSIAAGKTIESLERHLDATVPVIRSMPNTPASIGRGITAAFANENVTEAQREICTLLLRAVGEVVWLDSEEDMDAVTAVSGSGPAYVFALAEAMAEAGREAGLNEALAMKLARATVSGAGELMHLSELDAATLRENVTSPGGTTAAALDVLLAEPGIKELMTRAIRAACERSRELAT